MTDTVEKGSHCSSNQRKTIEMRFAHLKTHHRFERMRLRGISGARDEFHRKPPPRAALPNAER